jgi:hypothetical protein
MIYLLFLIPIGLGLLGMIAAGDLRVTPRQQREWEEYWAGMSPEERERMARLIHQ